MGGGILEINTFTQTVTPRRIEHIVLIVILITANIFGAQSKELRALAQQISPKVRIANDTEFFDAWNLDYPGMEAVKKAVEQDDYNTAKLELKKYFLKRRHPRWKINHWDMPKSPQGDAKQHSQYAEGEKILAHQFSGGGDTVEFGEKIDWNYFPLKLNNGRPDTEYPLIHYINRFGHLPKVLGPLYWFSHDERYAQEFVYEVTDHIASIPAPEKYIPYTAVWSKLTSCGPLNGTWLDAYNYFLPSKSFTPEAHATMLKGFIQKARYAMRAPDGENRYMFQLTAIYNCGAYFPELKQAKDYRDFAIKGLEACIEVEFYPDCVSQELCPGYHGASRGAYTRIIKAAQTMGYTPPPTMLQGLEKGYDFYPKIMTPLGGLPQFGDTWGTSDVVKTLRDVLPILDKPEYRWFTTNSKEGLAPNFVSTHLPWAGFYVMRSSWDKEALYLCLDAGPLGTGHWHEDYGNFECYAYGERLIAEMGIYSYTTNRWNRYFRSSLAHNVVLVDGLSQTRAAEMRNYNRAHVPRTNDWHSDEVFDLAWGHYHAKWVHWEKYVGWENGFGKADAKHLAQHRRDICFVKPNYWIINDRLTTPGDHTYSQLFHVLPDRSPSILKPGRVATTAPDRVNILLVQADPLPSKIITGREDPPQGWYSPKQAQVEPAPAIVFEQTTQEKAHYDTLLMPLQVGEKPTAQIERIQVKDTIGNIIPPSDVCALRITTSNGVDYYINDLRQDRIGPTTAIKTVGSIETDARTSIVRFNLDNQLKSVSAAGASYVQLDNQRIWTAEN